LVWLRERKLGKEGIMAFPYRANKVMCNQAPPVILNCRTKRMMPIMALAIVLLALNVYSQWMLYVGILDNLSRKPRVRIEH